MITLVHPSNIPPMIPALSEMLEGIAKKRGYTVEKILEPVLSMDAALWVVDDMKAVIVTQIIQRPLERVLFIDWLSGENVPEWADEWLGVIEQFAAKAGCSAIEANGRRGWKKYEGLANFKPIATVYRQELENG